MNGRTQSGACQVVLLDSGTHTVNGLGLYEVDRAATETGTRHSRSDHPRHRASDIHSSVQFDGTHLVQVAERSVALSKQDTECLGVPGFDCRDRVQGAGVLFDHVSAAAKVSRPKRFAPRRASVGRVAQGGDARTVRVEDGDAALALGPPALYSDSTSRRFVPVSTTTIAMLSGMGTDRYSTRPTVEQ